MLTIDEIEKFGFKEFKVLPHDKHDRVWAKMICDDIGKKFNVVIRFWQFSKFSNDERGKIEDSFDATCQFDMRGKRTFDVDVSVRDMTPQQIVDWFDNMFQKMECTYYERYHD